jgi:hypothetical protein
MGTSDFEFFSKLLGQISLISAWGRRFAGQPRRFCSHRSIDDRHRAAQAWHAVVRCHHAAPRLALFGLGTL